MMIGYAVSFLSLQNIYHALVEIDALFGSISP